VGLTQVADLAAVRGHLVAAGTIEAGRVALWGTSWGGYLTLLALGTQPRLWRLGVAISPIADYVAAFDAASPAVQALDVTLFGGTPEQMPQAYARSSPVTYVDQVRAPVLLAVSSDDVRCPPEPVQRYAGLLAARRIPHQLVRRRAGHDDFDARSHLSLMQTVLLFMQRHFDGVQEEGTPVALAMARPVS
jgi:dipeptidyl aminopeptidase/acylaminoacyl peptidase